jgi:hypothetical protein
MMPAAIPPLSARAVPGTETIDALSAAAPTITVKALCMIALSADAIAGSDQEGKLFFIIVKCG